MSWSEIKERLAVGKPWGWDWTPMNIGIGVGLGVGARGMAIGPGVGCGFSLRDGTFSYGAGIRAGLGIGGTIGMGKLKIGGMPVVMGMVIGPAVGIGRGVPGAGITYDKTAYRHPEAPAAVTMTPPNPPRVPGQ